MLIVTEDIFSPYYMLFIQLLLDTDLHSTLSTPARGV